MGAACFAGNGGDFGSPAFGASLVAGNAGSSPPAPSPTIVIFRFGFAGGAGVAGAAAADPGACTENVCPHFGHRIFSPCGGTRRSST